MNIKDIIIFDIDGTLANGEHRQQFVREKPKNWPRYNDLMHLDTVHEHVRTIYLALAAHPDYHLYLLSGRESKFRNVTEKWLVLNGLIFHNALYMRRENDYRADDIIKEELFNQYFGHQKERVLCVFDDRPRVIRMWRRIGIPVFNCGDGTEF